MIQPPVSRRTRGLGGICSILPWKKPENRQDKANPSNTNMARSPSVRDTATNNQDDGSAIHENDVRRGGAENGAIRSPNLDYY